jgi:O-antigen ligase
MTSAILISPAKTPAVVRFPVAGWAAASIAFLAAWEPNAAVRYGPFIATAAFISSRPLRFRIGATELALALFLLWAFLSQLWTEHPEVFETQMIVYASFAITFTGVHAAIRWGKNGVMAATGYVAGCLYGLAMTSFQLIAGEGPIYRDAFGRITQVGSLNVNYVAYTAVTAIVLLLMALQERQIKSRRMRMIAFATLIILVFGGLSTQTRGVQISIALLGIWFLVSRFGRPAKAVTAGCVIAIMSVSFGWADELLGGFDGGERSTGGLSGRLPLWESARATWQESIVTGAGLGADRAQNAYNLSTHNTFLGLGVTLGVVGLLLFLAFAASAVNDRIRILSVPEQRFRIITIIVAFTPILLTSPWDGMASGWVGLALLSTPIVAAKTHPETAT